MRSWLKRREIHWFYHFCSTSVIFNVLIGSYFFPGDSKKITNEGGDRAKHEFNGKIVVTIGDSMKKVAIGNQVRPQIPKKRWVMYNLRATFQEKVKGEYWRNGGTMPEAKYQRGRGVFFFLVERGDKGTNTSRLRWKVILSFLWSDIFEHFVAIWCIRFNVGSCEGIERNWEKLKSDEKNIVSCRWWKCEGKLRGIWFTLLIMKTFDRNEKTQGGNHNFWDNYDSFTKFFLLPPWKAFGGH